MLPNQTSPQEGQFLAPLPVKRPPPSPVAHTPHSPHVQSPRIQQQHQQLQPSISPLSNQAPQQSPFIDLIDKRAMNFGSTIEKKKFRSRVAQTPVFRPTTPLKPGSQSRIFGRKSSPHIAPISFGGYDNDGRSKGAKRRHISSFTEPRRKRVGAKPVPNNQSVSEFKPPRSSLDSLLLHTEPSFFEKDFDNLGIVGQGSFGRVYKVKHRRTGQIYAIKKSCRKFRHQQDRIRALKEVENYALLGQKLDSHCVKYFQAWEDQQHLFIQTEFCSRGTLKQYLSYIKEPLSEPRVWRFFIDITLGVKHVHAHNLVHLDIKPDNIFLTEEGVLKLGDFGIAVQTDEHKDLDMDGSAAYLAPEILDQGLGRVGQACDVFSLGLILFEMTAHVTIPSHGDAYQQLRNEEGVVIPPERSKELTSLISAMLRRDPETRPTVEQIIDSPCCRKHVAESHSPLVLPPPLEVTPVSNYASCFTPQRPQLSPSLSDHSNNSTPSPQVAPRNLFTMFNET